MAPEHRGSDTPSLGIPLEESLASASRRDARRSLTKDFKSYRPKARAATTESVLGGLKCTAAIGQCAFVADYTAHGTPWLFPACFCLGLGHARGCHGRVEDWGRGVAAVQLFSFATVSLLRLRFVKQYILYPRGSNDPP